MPQLVSLLEKIQRVFGKLLGAALIRRKSFREVVAYSNFIEASFSQKAFPTEQAAVMSIWPEAANLQSSSYHFPEVFTAQFRDITFCGAYNTLLANPFTVVEESISTVDIPLHRFDISAHFQKAETISGICAVFRSFEERNFYHTLIDNIPRVFLLHHPEYQNIPEIKLLCPKPVKEVEQHLLQSILPKNVKIYPVEKNKNYRIETLIFSSFLTQDYAAYLPADYLKLLDQKIVPQRPSKANKRIFISRAIKPHKIKNSRVLLNEDELFYLLEPYGFERFYLENLSCPEQIELFYDCEYIVAAHGAGLSNLIFSPQATVLELFPTSYVVPYFYFLCESRSHNYHYWCGPESHRDSNFTVDLTAIQKILENEIGIFPRDCVPS